MTGERDRLVADAFHQVAVRSYHVGFVVDDGVAEHCGEMSFGNRHAHGVGQSLTERTGGRFHAGRVAVFRMTGGVRAELAEFFDLIERHCFVAGEMKQRVDQHRPVAGGENKPVTIGPGRVGRVKLQKA